METGQFDEGLSFVASSSRSTYSYKQPCFARDSRAGNCVLVGNARSLLVFLTMFLWE
jgi:hypothetical protein